MRFLLFFYMLMIDFIYCISLPFLIVVAHFSRKVKEEVLPRVIPSPLKSRFILHGASAGEVRSLIPIAEMLKEKGADIHFTTSTLRGRIIAERYGFPSSFLPVESAIALKMFFRDRKKVVLVIGERDIWARFIRTVKMNGGRVLMVGVLYPEFTLKRRFMLELVRPYIDRIYVRSEEDYMKLSSAGFSVIKGGNLKVLSKPQDSSLAFNINYILFACTHNGEHEVIKEVCFKIRSKVRDLKFIIAPRYVEESNVIIRLFSKYFKVKRFKDREDEDWDVLVVDEFGILPFLYERAEVAFIGGSIVRRGGHDLFDACRYGVPVLIGPYYWNQKDVVKLLLEIEGIKIVKNADELYQGILKILEEGSELGIKAKLCYEKLKEEAHKTVKEVVAECLRG